MEDRLGTYWAQKTQERLSIQSTVARIRVGDVSSYPLRASIVIVDKALCSEMDNSRQAGRQIDPDRLDKLQEGIVSNTCVATRSESKADIKCD